MIVPTIIKLVPSIIKQNYKLCYYTYYCYRVYYLAELYVFYNYPSYY